MTDERLAEIKRNAAALALMKPGNVWTAGTFELAAEVERLRDQLAERQSGEERVVTRSPADACPGLCPRATCGWKRAADTPTGGRR